jgi:hypothetical protein
MNTIIILKFDFSHSAKHWTAKFIRASAIAGPNPALKVFLI